MAQINILILQCIKNIRKFIQTLQNRYVEMTSSKMPFTDKDGHLTKAFQKDIHHIASQLPKDVNINCLEYCGLFFPGHGVDTRSSATAEKQHVSYACLVLFL